MRTGFREYGEGLLIFEPNDLNEVSIIDLSKINDIDEQNILKIYALIESNYENVNIVNKSVSQLTEIFDKYL